MSSRKVSNINNYTLIEKNGLIYNIYFYPQCAIDNLKIKSRKDQLCVLFELKKEKEPQVYCMHTYLLDKDGNKVFHSYSMYLKETERYKYIIIKNKNEANHADVIKRDVLDFNTIDYDNFLTILSKNEELIKMIPDLKEGLEEKVESLENSKKKVAYIDLPSKANYYQNVIGILVDELANQTTTEEDLEFIRNTLRNIRRNFDLILNDKYQLNLAYLALYSIILNKVGGNTLKPTNILDIKDIKCDTNKTSIEYEDLEYILNSFINSLKEEEIELRGDLNIIQERIEYILTSKPKQKEIKEFIKVILIDDKYQDTTKRNRSIKEDTLKDLIINSFLNTTYRPLPRNQVLLYNETNNNIDFVCIASLDMIYTLLKTYKINSKDENKEYLELLKTIDNIIVKGQKKKNEKTLKISVLILIHMLIYNIKNIKKNTLIFNKGNFIIKLDYTNGDYDIKIVDRIKEKKYGKLCKLNEEAKTIIKSSLNKGEKSFNTHVNNLIYQSIEKSLSNLNINIVSKELTCNDTLIKFNKSSKENYFECTFNLAELLNIISSIKITKNEIKYKEELLEEPTEEISNKEENIDYDYIIRKTLAIIEMMKKTPMNNEKYISIIKLYGTYLKAEETAKKDILLKINELL